MRKIDRIWLRIGMFLDSFEEIPFIFFLIGICIIFTYGIYALISEIIGIKTITLEDIFWW